jgi:hypothetical protein
VRQCYEDCLLYRHRVQYGHSTVANHGRLHPYWTRPSNSTRGIPTTRRATPVNYASLSPAVGDDDFMCNAWLGLEWSKFTPLGQWTPPLVSGVYRIKHESQLTYCGESLNLRDRLRSHGTTSRFSGSYFSVHEMPEAASHQLKEREIDLIGGYFLASGCPPIHQYSPKAT